MKLTGFVISHSFVLVFMFKCPGLPVGQFFRYAWIRKWQRGGYAGPQSGHESHDHCDFLART